MSGLNSYSQNFEDVILWRALGHVSGGFYIDIGAQHPRQDSVSRAFYERGWRGVHVEPTLQYTELLRVDRPDERIVQAAVCETRGRMTFYEVADSGMSTGDKAIAHGIRGRGWQTTETEVDTITLDDVLDSVEQPDVHWLKIDVEGFETGVLQGWRSSSLRPWVILVEAVHPATRVPNHEAWEELIVDKGYDFVYFDGLNRFYVSQDHAELTKHFAYGPSVWDLFQLDEQSWATRALVDRQRHAVRDILASSEGGEPDFSGASSEAVAARRGLAAVWEMLEQARTDAARAQHDATASRESRSFLFTALKAEHRAAKRLQRELADLRMDRDALLIKLGGTEQLRQDLDLRQVELVNIQAVLGASNETLSQTNAALVTSREEVEDLRGELTNLRQVLAAQQEAFEKQREELDVARWMVSDAHAARLAIAGLRAETYALRRQSDRARDDLYARLRSTIN